MNVSAEVLCESDKVKISWLQASGAGNFLVTVSGSLGSVRTFNTTETLLTASLPCGRDFNVTVQEHGSTCDSIPSSAVLFQTGVKFVFYIIIYILQIIFNFMFMC